MKHLLVAFSILVLLLFPLQPLQVQAETGNIADYKEFDSFMKRYHEHTTELAYYVTTSYKSNEHYFGENFELFRNAVNSVYDTNKSEFLTKYLDSTDELLSKPIALLATANDLRKLVFDKIKAFFGKEEFEAGSTIIANEEILPPEGYLFKVDGYTPLYSKIVVGSGANYAFSIRFCTQSSSCDIVENISYGALNDTMITHPVIIFRNQFNSGQLTPDTFYKAWYHEGHPNIDLISIQTQEQKPIFNNVVPPAINNVFNNMINGNYDDKRLQDYTPTVNPLLVCPSGEIPLTYVNGVFETNQQMSVTLTQDETAIIGDETCNLDFKFPEIYYHDSGKLVVDGQDLTPVLPIVDYENGIIEYIRNSYDYATTLVNSGVNGLKSIVAGTAGLVTFSGSLFGFLPPELLTLFIGGFSVALGLWVFKK